MLHSLYRNRTYCRYCTYSTHRGFVFRFIFTLFPFAVVASAGGSIGSPSCWSGGDPNDEESSFFGRHRLRRTVGASAKEEGSPSADPVPMRLFSTHNQHRNAVIRRKLCTVEIARSENGCDVDDGAAGGSHCPFGDTPHLINAGRGTVELH